MVKVNFSLRKVIYWIFPSENIKAWSNIDISILSLYTSECDRLRRHANFFSQDFLLRGWKTWRVKGTHQATLKSSCEFSSVLPSLHQLLDARVFHCNFNFTFSFNSPRLETALSRSGSMRRIRATDYLLAELFACSSLFSALGFCIQGRALHRLHFIVCPFLTVALSFV